MSISLSLYIYTYIYIYIYIYHNHTCPPPLWPRGPPATSATRSLNPSH